MSGFCVTLMALPSRLNALKDFNGTFSLLKASKSLQRPQKPYQLSFLRPATHFRHTPSAVKISKEVNGWADRKLSLSKPNPKIHPQLAHELPRSVHRKHGSFSKSCQA